MYSMFEVSVQPESSMDIKGDLKTPLIYVVPRRIRKSQYEIEELGCPDG